MNKLKLFDPTGYMVKGKLRLKNITLENHKIMEIQSKKVECRMAVFHNVFFQNDLEDTFIEAKKCTFTNCIFSNAFWDNSNLVMQDCVFQNCLFENASMDIQGEMSGCRFESCNFRNMDLKGSFELSYLDVKGGMMENIHCLGNEISESCFSKTQLTHVDWQSACYRNKFESVIFKDVTLQYRKQGKNENEFFQCDTRGLTGTAVL